MELTLKPATPAFVAAAKTWHEDDFLNHAVGWATGRSGTLLSKAAIDGMYHDPEIWFIAIWKDIVPVGYLAIAELDELNRNGDVNLVIAPKEQGKGYGVEALKLICEEAWNHGFIRLTFKPLARNKQAIETAYKAGFKLEARLKWSRITADGPQDQAQMRAIKPY